MLKNKCNQKNQKNLKILSSLVGMAPPKWYAETKSPVSFHRSFFCSHFRGRRMTRNIASSFCLSFFVSSHFWLTLFVPISWRPYIFCPIHQIFFCRCGFAALKVFFLCIFLSISCSFLVFPLLLFVTSTSYEDKESLAKKRKGTKPVNMDENVISQRIRVSFRFVSCGLAVLRTEKKMDDKGPCSELCPVHHCLTIHNMKTNERVSFLLIFPLRFYLSFRKWLVPYITCLYTVRTIIRNHFLGIEYISGHIRQNVAEIEMIKEK